MTFFRAETSNNGHDNIVLTDTKQALQLPCRSRLIKQINVDPVADNTDVGWPNVSRNQILTNLTRDGDDTLGKSQDERI